MIDTSEHHFWAARRGVSDPFCSTPAHEAINLRVIA
jgi:hypothetical protein